MRMLHVSGTSTAALMAGLLALSSPANADDVWNWSFGGTSGTFTTTGSGAGAPGTYTLSDFSVTTPGAGTTTGSVSGGQYTPSGYDTNEPYSFDWSGSQVNTWFQSGENNFNWWVFTSNSNPDLSYFFGWAPGNINDPTSAALYSQSSEDVVTTGQVTVSPLTGAVPEPATWAMMLLGFGGIGFSMRRKQAPAFALAA